ncbi:MAG TPA: penicillin-binding protein [Candidatus Paceibacterota bacterium]|nr:penicillin-binding protein [Candidatus Paceibacterota bacterium]
MKLTKSLVNIVLFFIALGLFLGGGALLWAVNLKIPDFKAFDNRKISRSTKIYDRTGEILLYNIHNETKRTVVPWEEIGVNIKNATVAVEDSEFYHHKGIRLESTARALLTNLLRGDISGQGGSTITQQVVKNTLLTGRKTFARKLKEWILALKIEQVLGKEEILAAYLNETPYGGNLYGVYEASQAFFGKEPGDLTKAEAAYLAAIPKAPTFYSPYGNHKEKLGERKNFILKRMSELGFITGSEYQAALEEKIEFKSPESIGLKAPHFVFYIKEYLEEKYGKDVDTRGLKIITTLDYDLQKQAEEIVLRQAKENEKNWNASNAGLVVIDPKTGQVLVMVGSRDYFDKEIDGNFNITTATRQPGSAFKPFVYARAFEEGFTPDSVLFDLPTEFQTTCDPYGQAYPGKNQKDCYKPENFDNKYKGPVNLRTALGESRNIPSVKLLYLVGINDAIKTAKNMGINTLSTSDRYGLTLVLGGGEVKLLEMVSAYGSFATGGVRHPHKSILKIEDDFGNRLEEYQDDEYEILSKNSVAMLNNVLSDNEARTPLFGPRSFLYFEGREVAGKTGTTEDNRDAWLIGYTPSVVLGVWNGNNDNSSMKKGSSITGPMWHEFMQILLNKFPEEGFDSPVITENIDYPPIIRGFWQGGKSFFIDKISGKLATDFTPPETKEERVITNVHSILYWINKNSLSEKPEDPIKDNQFLNWETSVENWWQVNKNLFSITSEEMVPIEFDDVHTEEKTPTGSIVGLKDSYLSNEVINFTVSTTAVFEVQQISVYVNGVLVDLIKNPPYTFSIDLGVFGNLKPINELLVVIVDSVWNKKEILENFQII